MKLLSNLIIFLAFIFFSSANAATNESPSDPYQHFFNETWGDFSEEITNAKEKKKKAILIFFEMDECPFCHWMKTNVLNQPSVQTYFREHFLNFPVDIEGDIEITDFSGKTMTQKHFSTKVNRVRATPVFAIFDLQGKTIARFTGRTSSVEEFMWLGQYVVEGFYEQMSFVKFKRMKKKEATQS